MLLPISPSSYPGVLALIALAGTVSPPVPSTLAGELDTLKSNTDRWIEIRSRLSREQSNWDADKDILKDSIDTLEASKQSLEKDLRLHKLKTQELDQKTTEAEKSLAAFERTNDILLSQITEYEDRVRRLAARLPPPLIERLRSLLLKLPASSDQASVPVPNRVQNLISILALIDEFNNKLTLSHTIKSLDKGEAIEVRVLYWGLATGYAINATGTQSWILEPGEAEWAWRPADQHTAAIARLFKVYDKSIDPTLVDAPFKMKTDSPAR